MAIQVPDYLGPWKPKVTRIVNMWMQPCDINPIVWVAGYFAASPVIAYTILTPDCQDIASERGRQGHKKRRKSTLRLADWAGPINVPTTGYQNVAFKIFQAAQRIGWWFTLIDATAEWFIHGTSLAYQWSGCRDPNAPHANLSMTNATMFLLPAQTSYINTWTVDAAVNISAGPGGIAVPKGFSVGVGYTLTQNLNTIPGLPDATFQSRLVDVGETPISPWQDAGPVVNDQRSTTWFTPIASTILDAHLYRVQVRKSHGVLIGSGSMTAGGDNFQGVFASACGSSTGAPR